MICPSCVVKTMRTIEKPKKMIWNRSFPIEITLTAYYSQNWISSNYMMTFGFWIIILVPMNFFCFSSKVQGAFPVQRGQPWPLKMLASNGFHWYLQIKQIIGIFDLTFLISSSFNWERSNKFGYFLSTVSVKVDNVGYF